jgi:predicted nucleic acid-binding protein
MRAVDTSVWIEWLTDSALGRKLAPQMPAPAECPVPTMVQLELAKWLMREAGATQLAHMMSYTAQCMVVSLDTRIALSAAALHRQYKLATADSVIYATTLACGTDLLTCDAHFEHLPSVLFVRKIK